MDCVFVGVHGVRVAMFLRRLLRLFGKLTASNSVLVQNLHSAGVNHKIKKAKLKLKSLAAKITKIHNLGRGRHRRRNLDERAFGNYDLEDRSKLYILLYQRKLYKMSF